jgi:hypothetical protein
MQATAFISNKLVKISDTILKKVQKFILTVREGTIDTKKYWIK